MALRIERKSDSRVIKAILHRIADVPGGVSVKTAELGGSALQEGTPLAYSSSDGFYHVCKTAKVVTAAANDATSYEIAKGSHFKVGDYFATEGANGKQITAIDKSGASKDVITVGTTLGAVIAEGVIAFESTGGNKTVKYAPTAIAGESSDVTASENLFASAWVIAVVRKGNAPLVNDTVSATLKGIHYIV
jgi:hypothetical protein